MSNPNNQSANFMPYKIKRMQGWSFLDYQDELYRDPRMYVINLTNATVKNADQTKEKKWTLATYKNTINLRLTRQDTFSSKDEAIKYLKEIEPLTPLITLDGKIKNYASSDLDERWGIWCKYLLRINGLSAITEYQNFPFHAYKEGGSFTHKEYLSVSNIEAK
ncbi:hypothetical protein N9H97_03975 [Gammaproteobacteria bacterium]|nr:hypothetical protein [Gammaproteobacteria bacterium]